MYSREWMAKMRRKARKKKSRPAGYESKSDGGD
jgi:hypothetical protein